MPDSWIDKDELDELVKSLPSSGKVRRRVPAGVRRAAERSRAKATEAAESPPGDEGHAVPPGSAAEAPAHPLPEAPVETAASSEPSEWEETVAAHAVVADEPEPEPEPELAGDFETDSPLVEFDESGGAFEWVPETSDETVAAFGFAEEEAPQQAEAGGANAPLPPSLFELDDESEEEWEADGWSGEDTWEEGAEAEFAAEGETALGYLAETMEDMEEGADAAAAFPEPAEDPFENSPEVEFLEEPSFGEDGAVAPERGSEPGSVEEAGPEIVLAEHPAEGGRRELPGFLDDSDEWFSPRPVSLSERDADRALVALAEARIRAERAQLIRPRSAADSSTKPEPPSGEETEVKRTDSPHRPESPEPPEAEETAETFEPADMFEALEPEAEETAGAFEPAETPEPETPEAEQTAEPFEPPEVLESGPFEAENLEWPWEEDLPEVIEEDPPVETADESENSLATRLERFGAMSRQQLGALEVAVCDAAGFLLYSDSDRPGDSALATALLLDVSTRTSQLLGLEESNATQVSVEDGSWRCLLRGSDGAGGLCAGLLLGRPLGAEEVLRWCDGLAGANQGGGSPLWRSFVEGADRAGRTTG